MMVTRILLLFSALLLGTPAVAADAPPDMSLKGDFSVFAAPNSGYRFQTLNFTSADGARGYRVSVGIPQTAPPAGGFPVLFALDGNALPELLSAERLRRLNADSPLLLVLVGHAGDLRFDAAARAYDYTPPAADGKPFADALNPARQNGGAAAFLPLLTRQIRPAVARLAPVNPARQTLWGHSYGGLFVLHTLLQQPDAFQQYIAADPSLWWQNGLLLKQADAAFRRPLRFNQPTGLWLQKSRPGQRAPAAAPTAQLTPQQQQRLDARRRAVAAVPPDALPQLAARLRTLPNLSVHEQDYPQHTHGSLLGASFLQALDIAAQPEDKQP